MAVTTNPYCASCGSRNVKAFGVMKCKDCGSTDISEAPEERGTPDVAAAREPNERGRDPIAAMYARHEKAWQDLEGERPARPLCVSDLQRFIVHNPTVNRLWQLWNSGTFPSFESAMIATVYALAEQNEKLTEQVKSFADAAGKPVTQ